MSNYNYNNLPKDVKLAIARSLNKEDRILWNNGKVFRFTITRSGKALKRWGHSAIIECNGKGKIIYNSLVDLAWDEDEDKAAVEAANALSYFVYGDKDEYSIVNDSLFLGNAEILKDVSFENMIKNTLNKKLANIVRWPLCSDFEYDNRKEILENSSEEPEVTWFDM